MSNSKIDDYKVTYHTDARILNFYIAADVSEYAKWEIARSNICTYVEGAGMPSATDCRFYWIGK